MIDYIVEFIKDFFTGNPVDVVCSFLIAAFGFFTAYKTVYTVIGFLLKGKRFPKTDKRFKYAYVVSARNEEKVIANLVTSILSQNYPKELMTVYVIADNCTDKTAEVARNAGAVVYERFNDEKRRKGYALEEFFGHMEKEQGFDNYDGYFIFDADNLLAPDFTEQMNRAFATGAKIVTSYRNSKNFDTNFISAGYGIHFYHNTISKHRPRSLLKVGTHLTGTGYLFAADVIKDGGWHFTNLTEDDEFSLTAASKGVFVEFCEAAEFFDEQPVDFGTVMRQRIRWARGRIVNFVKHGGAAFKAIFKQRHFTNYDMFFHYLPVGLCTWILGVIYPTFSFIYSLANGESISLLPIIRNILVALLGAYFSQLVSGIVTVMREYRHINCSMPKLILYVFLYPWFSMISVYLYLVAIFWDIKWSPIEHNDSRNIGDMKVFNNDTANNEQESK